MSTKIVAFNAFLKLAKFCYITNGIVLNDEIRQHPAKHSANGGIAAKANSLLQLFAFIILVNTYFVLLTELAFVVVNFMENADFLQAARNFCFVGFVIVSIIKYWNGKRQSARLSVLIRELYEMYPKQALDQAEYELQSHLDHYRLFSFSFSFLYAFTVWCYNALPLINYLIFKQWLQRDTWERELPYYCWLPFEWRDNWLYYLLYVSQAIAGHTCCAAYLSTDLMMCAATTQLIMHFRKLARDIERYEPGCESEQQIKNDLSFLSAVVSYHHQTLALCQLVNEIFGVPTLINFISTTFVMCFLAFQFMVGVSLDAMITLFLYMVSSVVQIYMICTYGQDLIMASENIGHAAYNHNWLMADIRYKKMVVMIIQRAQRTAILQATSFVHVSMGTLTDLLQLSYKFLALLRTMYVR